VSRRLVVEADGGSRGNPGPAAWGAVVRDSDTGEVLAELAEVIGTATNNVAEYSGLVAGLRAANAIDPEASVDVRLDSKLVIEQMAGRWQVKNPTLRGLASQARSVFPDEQVTWRWVPRAQNAHADRLLNEALDAAVSGERPVERPVQGSAGRPIDGHVEVHVDEAEVEPATPSRLLGWGDLGPPTTLRMLRHGETPFTVEKRFSGAGGADPGLTETGFAQARRAAAHLEAAGDVGVIVASPLRRTQETATVVADRLGLDVLIEDGFRECAFGEWDGLTFTQVKERTPELLDHWLGSTSVAPPGGESFDDVSRRVVEARDKVLARHAGRTVLVVTHVTPIKTLVRLALDAPAHAVFRMELLPASLAEVQYYEQGVRSVRSFNVVP